jgi:hypothetical protein
MFITLCTEFPILREVAAAAGKPCAGLRRCQKPTWHRFSPKHLGYMWCGAHPAACRHRAFGRSPIGACRSPPDGRRTGILIWFATGNSQLQQYRCLITARAAPGRRRQQEQNRWLKGHGRRAACAPARVQWPERANRSVPRKLDFRVPRARRQMATGGVPGAPTFISYLRVSTDQQGVVSPNRRKFRQAGFRPAKRPASGNFPVFDGWRGAIR